MKNPVSKLIKKLFRKKKNKTEKGKKYEELSETCTSSTNYTYYVKKAEVEKPAENDYSEYKASTKVARVAPQPHVPGFDDLTWLTKSNRESRESMAPEEIMKMAIQEEKKEEVPVVYRENNKMGAKSVSQSVFYVNMVTEQAPVSPYDVYASIRKEKINLKPVTERKPTPYREDYSNPVENFRKTQRIRSPPPKYQTFVREKVQPEVRRPRQSMPYGGVVQQCKCGNHQKEKTRKDLATPDMEILLDDAFIRMTIAKKVMRKKRSQVDLAFYESKRAEKQYEAVKTEFLHIRQRRMSMPAGPFEVYGEVMPRKRVRNQDYYDF